MDRQGVGNSIDPIDRTNKRKVEASDGRDPGACDRRRSQQERVIEEEVSMIDYDEARRPRVRWPTDVTSQRRPLSAARR